MDGTAAGRGEGRGGLVDDVAGEHNVTGIWSYLPEVVVSIVGRRLGRERLLGRSFWGNLALCLALEGACCCGTANGVGGVIRKVTQALESGSSA